MTNKEGKANESDDAHKTSLFAVYFVSQVLEEASIIVNAAKESGSPWLYLSSLKKMRNFELDDSYNKELTFVVNENQYLHENEENTVVTSTPQKMENKVTKSMNECGFIGQGDEELDGKGYELRKCTSMFINNLFDMSDVEHLITDEPDIIQTRNSRSEELLTENVYKQDFELQQFNNEYSKSTEYSSYSFLSDFSNTEILKEVDFSTYNNETNGHQTLGEVEYLNNNNLPCDLNETIEEMDNNDLIVYENAYLTMNRDYEQYSEEEEPVLLDPKAASLQEIELVATKASKDDLASRQVPNKLDGFSGVSTSGTSSRKSIVRRCRHHGARLLSCLKGLWWRRKLFGKRKDPRINGSIRGLCPLSPDVRRRAASLLDQRNLLTPSPSKSLGWKFNTVNEALVHSSRWKDFGIKMSLNENDEF